MKEKELKAKEVYDNESPKPQPIENPEFLKYDISRQTYMDYMLEHQEYYTWTNKGYERKYKV